MKQNEVIWKRAFEQPEGAYSPHTLRGYKADFSKFEGWCAKNAFSSLPTSPEIVAKYVNQLSQEFAASTVKHRIVAIRKVHRLVNLPDPTNFEIVDIAFRRARRKKLARPKQALGLNEDLRDQLIEACDNTTVGIRNKALISVGYDTLCRRSELVALRVEDIERRKSGARILVRRAKNDPFGTGRKAAISRRGLDLLDKWLSHAEIKNGPIFRPVYNGVICSRFLNPYTVTRILKQAAECAGTETSIVQQISSHSMRVGAAQDLILNGHNILMVMAAGGWRSINIVGRYVENVDLRIWD